MSPNMNSSSSPLSSAKESPTPPGAWVDDSPVSAPAATAATAPAATPTSVTNSSAAATTKNGSQASSTSSASPSRKPSFTNTKRPHVSVEPDNESTKASAKRAKKAGPSLKSLEARCPTAPIGRRMFIADQVACFERSSSGSLSAKITAYNPNMLFKDSPVGAKAAASNAVASNAASSKAGVFKAASPGPVRTSGRVRKAPERFTSAFPPVKPQSQPRKAAAPRRSRIYDPVFLTTHFRSRLTKTDLFHMLLRPGAWETVTHEEKLQVLSLLPEDSVINRNLNANLRAGTAGDNERPREWDINFTPFRTDVSKYKDDLVQGQLGKQWIAEAEQAVLFRSGGGCDDWKDDVTEMWYGQ